MRRPVGFFLLTIVAATLASLIVYYTLRQKQAEIEKARAGKTSIVVAARFSCTLPRRLAPGHARAGANVG